MCHIQILWPLPIFNVGPALMRHLALQCFSFLLPPFRSSFLFNKFWHLCSFPSNEHDRVTERSRDFVRWFCEFHSLVVPVALTQVSQFYIKHFVMVILTFLFCDMVFPNHATSFASNFRGRLWRQAWSAFTMMPCRESLDRRNKVPNIKLAFSCDSDRREEGSWE